MLKHWNFIDNTEYEIKAAIDELILRLRDKIEDNFAFQAEFWDKFPIKLPTDTTHYNDIKLQISQSFLLNNKM